MIRTFDMFSGGGGSSWGAALAGASVIGGVDAWTLATEVFADNFPEAKVFCGRVEELEPRVIIDEIGPIDLMLASPECTNHSCARGARPRVEESRDTAFEVVRYARVMRPRWIVIENVIHMRPWSRYQGLLQALREQGYRVAEHVLDAADHGVPQRRKRLFLLCDRECDPPVTYSEESRAETIRREHSGRAGDLESLATRQRSTCCRNPGKGGARLRRTRKGCPFSNRLLRKRWRGWLATTDRTSPHNHDT